MGALSGRAGPGLVPQAGGELGGGDKNAKSRKELGLVEIHGLLGARRKEKGACLPVLEAKRCKET